MITSRFSIKTYLFVVIPFVTFIFPIYLFFNRFEAFGNHHNQKFLFIASLFWLTCFYSILGIIKRVVTIKITDQEITTKNIFRSKKHIKLKDFDGYETTSEISRGGSYEVVYLMKNQKSLIHISEFHLSNYNELKSLVQKNINNLGYSSFNFLSDWKRYF
jgi:hypothetical protein